MEAYWEPRYFPKEYADLLFRTTAEFPSNLANVPYPMRAVSRLARDEVSLEDFSRAELSPDQKKQAGELAARFHKASDVKLPEERATIESLGSRFQPIARGQAGRTIGHIEKILAQGALSIWQQLPIDLRPLDETELKSGQYWGQRHAAPSAKDTLRSLSPLFDIADEATKAPEVKQTVRDILLQMKQEKLTPEEVGEGPGKELVSVLVEHIADRIVTAFDIKDPSLALEAAKKLVPQSGTVYHT